MMKVIFCDSVIDNRLVDPDYQSEFDAAIKNQLETEFFSYEMLLEGDAQRATKFIKPCSSQTKAIYRGWMMKPEMYELLYDTLLEKNIQLINAPAEYAHCHYLPNSYEMIQNLTPKSVWTTHFSMEHISELVNVFGASPIIVKDFVKSEKHHWEEACFISNASDFNLLQKITNRFLELRGDHLNEGLVFREFIELEYLTSHSKSGMPLTKEFRLFCLQNEIIETLDYWEEGHYDSERLPLELFEDSIKKINSQFFTMDIAKQKNGEWIIMELGDAQVAGLPEKTDIDDFYKRLKTFFN